MTDSFRVSLAGFGFLTPPGAPPASWFVPPKHLPPVEVPGLPSPIQFTYANVVGRTQKADLVLVHDCVAFGPDIAERVRTSVRGHYPKAAIIFIDSRSGVVRIAGERPAVAALAAVAVDRVAAAWDEGDPLVISFDDGTCAVYPRFDGEMWVVDVPSADGRGG